jgi:hypothetical protein
MPKVSKKLFKLFPKGLFGIFGEIEHYFILKFLKHFMSIGSKKIYQVLQFAKAFDGVHNSH